MLILLTRTPFLVHFVSTYLNMQVHLGSMTKSVVERGDVWQDF